jgi:hypothetical protein
LLSPRQNPHESESQQTDLLTVYLNHYLSIFDRENSYPSKEWGNTMNSRILTSVVSLVIATVSTTTANPIAATHGYTACAYTPANISVTITLGGIADPADNISSPVAFTTGYPSDNWFYTESLSVGTGDPVVYGTPFVYDDNWYALGTVSSSVGFDFGGFFETQISRSGVVPQVGDVIKVTRGFRAGDPTVPTDYAETICELTITYTVIPDPPFFEPRPCFESLENWISCRTPAALPQTV